MKPAGNTYVLILRGGSRWFVWEKQTNVGEETMQSLSLRNLTLAATLSFAALSTPASAQSVSADVMSRCAKVVSGIKFEGQPAERNRDMMNLACLSNGGSIPGGAQEQPVSLKGRQPARR